MPPVQPNCLSEMDSDALNRHMPASRLSSCSHESSSDDGSIPEMIMSASFQSLAESDIDSLSSSQQSFLLGLAHSPVSPRSIFQACWSSPEHKTIGYKEAPSSTPPKRTPQRQILPTPLSSSPISLQSFAESDIHTLSSSQRSAPLGLTHSPVKSLEKNCDEDELATRLQELQMPLVSEDEGETEDEDPSKSGVKANDSLMHKIIADDAAIDYMEALPSTPPKRTPRRQILPTPPPPTPVSLQSFAKSDIHSISSSQRSSPLGLAHSPVSPRSIFQSYCSSSERKMILEKNLHEGDLATQPQELQMPLVSDDEVKTEDEDPSKSGVRAINAPTRKAIADDAAIDYREALQPTPLKRTSRRQILPTPPSPTPVLLQPFAESDIHSLSCSQRSSLLGLTHSPVKSLKKNRDEDKLATQPQELQMRLVSEDEVETDDEDPSKRTVKAINSLMRKAIADDAAIDYKEALPSTPPKRTPRRQILPTPPSPTPVLLQSSAESDIHSLSSSQRSSPLGLAHSPVSPRSILQSCWSSSECKKSLENNCCESELVTQLQELQMPLVPDDEVETEDEDTSKSGVKAINAQMCKAIADGSGIDYKEALPSTPPKQTPRRQILPMPPPRTAVPSSLIMPHRQQLLATDGRRWSSTSALLLEKGPNQSCLRKSRYSCPAITPGGAPDTMHRSLRDEGCCDLHRCGKLTVGSGGADISEELKKSVSFYSHVSVFEFAVPPDQRKTQKGWSSYFA